MQIEEVIECEIGNINIQQTDPVEINLDIHLPLRDDKLVKLQESDPHMKQLRKQWQNKNLDPNMYTMENTSSNENSSTTDSCTHP